MVDLFLHKDFLNFPERMALREGSQKNFIELINIHRLIHLREDYYAIQTFIRILVSLKVN